MTTNVVVTAHCSEDKEVVVSINSENTGEVHTLKDGESGEWVVYDDLEISVKERVQQTEGEAAA